MHNIEIRPAESYDLRVINRIIESAVMNWPASHRFKRLAVAPLLYDAVDLDNFEILVATFNSEVVGVAAWDGSSLPDGRGGTFHGLYVLPLLQQQGIGRALMDDVFSRARANNVPGLLVKAQRFSRSFFEHQDLDAVAANDDEYPWQYWKHLA